MKDRKLIEKQIEEFRKEIILTDIDNLILRLLYTSRFRYISMDKECNILAHYCKPEKLSTYNNFEYECESINRFICNQKEINVFSNLEKDTIYKIVLSDDLINYKLIKVEK